MSSNTVPKFHQEKEIDGVKYAISNDNGQLNVNFFNEAFGTKNVYWTGPMSDEAVKTMIGNSCVLGLYVIKPRRIEANRNIAHNTIQVPEQIGFGRMVTDYATLAYITDVYISPEYHGKGLGTWMMACMKEIIDSMPSLRRAILLTQKDGRGIKFYERELGMKVYNPQEQKYTFMQYVPYENIT
jgi:GNAT superfamily N-acetyltransferase